jgi:hypothetical protein
MERETEGGPWFQPAYDRLTSSDDSPVYCFGFAHWFLILLFLLPWSAWLFLHWKREQKKLA